MKLTLFINGTSNDVYCDSNETLLDVLRDRIGLKEVKAGCRGGECGSCTVILNGKAVNSCLVLAAEADGAEIVTIKGLSKEALSPLQTAFVEEGAIQCGFCTAGFVLTAAAYLRENPRPNDEEIKRAVVGNLCRCTGYQSVVKAIRRASGGAGGETK